MKLDARLLMIVPLSAVALNGAAADATRPNLVVILADDLGYADIGCYGQKRIRTPNLDRMASEGMRFTNFYVASSLCTPSRAALLTGSYAQRVGLGVCSRERDGAIIPWHVLYPNSRQGLNPDEITVAEILKEHRYSTACIGKWHLGDPPPFLPTRQGFDYYFGVPYSNDMKPTVMMRGEQVIENNTDLAQITLRYTEEATNYIQEKKDVRFFLYLAHNAPHTPLHPSPQFRGKSAGGVYGDVVEELDWSVGQVFNALKKAGVDDQTLVVFLSDNGPWIVRGEKGGIATPFRNGKGSTYEGGHRVPFIARWPGRIPAGKVCDEMATAMDILPTFTELSGARVPADRVIDGKSILSLLKADNAAKTPHDRFYYYFMDELQSVRSGEWKLKLETTAAHDSHYTFYGDPNTTVPESLYNLDADPGEQKSVLKDHPDIVAKLRQLAEEARADLGDSSSGIRGKNRRPAGLLDSQTLPPATP